MANKLSPFSSVVAAAAAPSLQSGWSLGSSSTWKTQCCRAKIVAGPVQRDHVLVYRRMRKHDTKVRDQKGCCNVIVGL